MRRMTAIAYIRRSARSRTDPGDLSREFQIEKVRELAGPDAATLRVVDADWGRSAATDKTDRRIAFLELLEAVERGEVGTLYAYATDRLARSVEWAARLLNACRRAGTVIVTSEGRFEPDNAMTDQLFYFQAMQNEGFSRQAQAKRRATVDRQRARGDKMGPAYYGSLAGESLPAVLAAFEEAGSAHGAGRLLNARGVPTRRGGPWMHAAVRNILVREGKMPKMGTRGAKTRAAFRLYRLLRCGSCDAVLTGVVQRYATARGRQERVIYRCLRGDIDPSHGPKSIGETLVMPYIRARVEAKSIPATVERATQDADRAALEAKRERYLDMYGEGLIDKAKRDAELTRLDQDLDKLDALASVVAVPRLAERWDEFTPVELNGILRSMVRHVELGPDLRPVDIAWQPGWDTAAVD